jgi:hypothetical protein
MNDSMQLGVREVDRLLYTQAPEMIKSIKYREKAFEYAKIGTGNISQNSNLVFEIVSDQLVDMSTMTLDFDLVIPYTGSNTIADRVLNLPSNAVDVVDQVSVDYNSEQVEHILNANKFANVFLAYSANMTYLKSEGEALLGLNTQFTNELSTDIPVDGDEKKFELPPGWEFETGGVTVTNSSIKRRFSVPVSTFSAFARCQNYLPLFGNKLRYTIRTATNDQVISYTGGASVPSYRLDNVQLWFDTVVLADSYKQQLAEAMASDQGIRLSYTTYDVSSTKAEPNTSQVIKRSYNLGNVCSLEMLLDSSVKVHGAKKWAMKCQAFGDKNFSGLVVRSGTRYFTPPQGLNSHIELFVESQKCLSNLNDYMGTGVINTKVLRDGYVQVAAAGADANDSPAYRAGQALRKSSYGICLYSVNLEKVIGSDYSMQDVINTGVSSRAVGASNEFDITVKHSDPGEIGNNSFYLTALIHKRQLIFQNSAVSVLI